MPFRYQIALIIVLLSALIVPIWLTEITPLVDLPNHAARIHILANYETTPFYKDTFDVVYAPIPNMAMDLIMVPITNTVGLWNASRIFLTLTVLFFVFGCFLIGSYKQSGFSYSSFIAAFFIYSGTFFYGYLNYVFSVSLFLVTLGLWLRWRNTMTPLRLLSVCLLAFGVYLSHLSSIAFLAMAIIIIDIYDLIASEVVEKRSRIDLIKDLVIFIGPAAAFLGFMEGSGSGSVGTLAWNSLGGKIVGLISPFRSYDLWIDITSVLSVIIAFIVLKAKNALEIDTRLLLLAALFFLVYIPAPERFFTNDADMRIVLPAFVLLVLALRPILQSKIILATLLLPLLLLTARQGIIASRWIEMETIVNREETLLSGIMENKTIYPVYGKGLIKSLEKKQRPLLHIVNIAAIEKGTISPNLFAIKGQNPLTFRNPMLYASLDARDQYEWCNYITEYNYVITFGVSTEAENTVSRWATLIGSTEKMKLWEVKKINEN